MSSAGQVGEVNKSALQGLSSRDHRDEIDPAVGSCTCAEEGLVWNQKGEITIAGSKRQKRVDGPEGIERERCRRGVLEEVGGEHGY